MYAVVETGGKQFIVREGDTIFVEKLSAEVESEVVENYSKPKSKIRRRDDTVMEIAEVFCVICTVLAGFAIIPLCWMIPLTIALHNKIKNKEPISVALKVVILLFVSVIGGILILVGDDSEE